MRRLVLSMMVSVDGFTEGENRELDWHVWDDELERHMTQFFTTVDTMRVGGVAYELMISYWPTATDSIAPQMNNLPKLVLSNTLQSPEWNSRAIKGDIAGEINRLKQQDGKDMVVFGGAGAAQTLMELGLIDEYQLIVNPVILGAGRPLFKPGSKKVNLKLVDTVAFRCGNVKLYYQPV